MDPTQTARADMKPNDTAAEPATTNSLWRRLPAEIALSAHLVICVATLLLAPRGFPVSHPRFWLFLGFPVALMAGGAWGLAGLFKQRGGPARRALCVMGGGWLGLSLAAGWLFSVSVGDRWGFGGLLAGATFLAAIPLVGGWRWGTLTSAAVGVGMGVFAAHAVRAPEPTTHPLDSAAPPAWQSTESALAAARGGTIRLSDGRVSVALDPLLGFDRVSPDRFLSLVAPPGGHRAVGEVVGEELRFADGTTLRLAREEGTPSVRFAAATAVAEDTYTHLNTYAHLTVRVGDDPWVRFSPCGDTRVSVEVAGYPTGLPARFASLDSGGRFSVVEASSAEKGPFTRLAAGPLGRGEPLTIWFGSGEEDLVSLRLDDWSAQLSTDLSPTAGWGVPQNAIEFQLPEEGSEVIEVWITLAATSVGRGWDTVGHRAGVYLNRGELQIQSLESGQDAASASE